MNTKVFNFVLFIIWTVMFAGLITRQWWMSDALLQKVDTPQTPLLMALAGVFALWNGARLWAAYYAVPAANRPTVADKYRQKIRGITGEDPRVTDPQFDFNAPNNEEPSTTEKPL